MHQCNDVSLSPFRLNSLLKCTYKRCGQLRRGSTLGDENETSGVFNDRLTQEVTLMSEIV